MGAKHKGMGLNEAWEVGDDEGECGRLSPLMRQGVEAILKR